MAFKAKTKNRNPINTTKTLDALHSDIIGNFKKDEDNVYIYEKKLAIIIESIDNLKAKDTNNIPYSESINILQEIWNLENESNKIKIKIEDIKNKTSETDYLLNTGQLLEKYYKSENDDEIDDIENSQLKKSKNSKKKRSILDWIKDEKQKNDTSNNNPINSDNLENKNKTKCETDDIPNYIKKITHRKKLMNSLPKNKIYKKYMNIINKDYIKYSSSEEEDVDICENCNKEMLLEHNTGILLCPGCGLQEQVLVDSDKPSYKDPPKEITSFCYKRINHLNEFLAQFQAKETTEIPEELYNEILVEIKKERIDNMVNITQKKMRQILKKIRRNDYYEHIPYIINQLNGLPPPVISPEVEDIVRSMFKEIQIPFEKYCPKKRTNFLSYNYVMYKFFELLELDKYLECFQLLKSRNKLYQQDQIWKNICRDLKWQYIPSS